MFAEPLPVMLMAQFTKANIIHVLSQSDNKTKGVEGDFCHAEACESILFMLNNKYLWRC